MKRIALVAVSALGLSIMASAPSNALVNADSLALGATATSTTVNSAATNTAQVAFLAGAVSDAAVTTVTLTSAPAGNTALPVFVHNTTSTISTTVSDGTSVTFTTTAANKLFVGDRVTVSGSSTAGCNTNFTVASVISSTVFKATSAAVCNGAIDGTITYNGGTNTNQQALSNGGQTMTTTSIAAGAVNVYEVVAITPNKVGTYVMTFSQTVGGVVTRTATWTLTVNDYAAVSALYSKATLASGNTNSKAYGDLSDTVSMPVSTAVAGYKLGVIKGFAYSGLATDRTSVTSFTATVLSGPGTVSVSGANTGGSLTGSTSATSVTAGDNFFAVYSTGTAGTIKVQVSAAGVVIGTATLVVYGAASTYDVTNIVNTVAASGVASVGAIEVDVADANGNPVNGATVYASAGTAGLVSVTASAVTDSTGAAMFDVTGLLTQSGKATITFSNATTSPTITATTSVTVSSQRAAAVSIKTDKASYAPGEKITFTLTAADASGNPLATGIDVSGNLLKSSASNPVISAAIVPATPFVGNVSKTLTDGAATAVAYAPLVSGPVSLTWTLAGTAGGSATTYLSAALVGTTVTTSFDVATSTSQQASITAANAAADAALEAIDAANAATDAANLAAEAADAATMAAQDAKDAADAATAAVEKLAQDVATMIDALKAQLATLANVVAKIAKKVKA